MLDVSILETRWNELDTPHPGIIQMLQAQRTLEIRVMTRTRLVLSRIPIMPIFKRRRFPAEIILLCIRWHCKYSTVAKTPKPGL
jgi:hypothetical protein